MMKGGVEGVGEVVEVEEGEDRLEGAGQDLRTVEIITEMRSRAVKVDHQEEEEHVELTLAVSLRDRPLSNSLTHSLTD